MTPSDARRSPTLRRLQRSWHVTLKLLVDEGYHPRVLTQHERRGAQLVLLGAFSVWDVPEPRAHKLLQRLREVREESLAHLAWKVWLHGVVAPGPVDEPGNADRIAWAEERYAMNEGLPYDQRVRASIRACEKESLHPQPSGE